MSWTGASARKPGTISQQAFFALGGVNIALAALVAVAFYLTGAAWQALAAGACFFALSFVSSLVFTRWIMRPIQQMTTTIQRIAEGESDLVVDERGSHEQMVLARQFNLMNRALQAKIKGLETETRQADEELVMSVQALRESETRYRQLFEMESDALFLIDNETGRILDVNQAAQSLYGYGRDELTAMSNADISAEPESTRQVTLRGLRDSEIVGVSLRRHRKKNGAVFPVEITGSVFELDGRSVHIAAIRDITERRKAQELLESWNAALERRVTERTAESEKRMRQLQLLTGRLIRAEESERQRITDVLHEDLQQLLVAARMTMSVGSEPVRSPVAKESFKRVDGMLSQSIRMTRTLVQDISVPAVKEGELPTAVNWIIQQTQEKFGLKVTLEAGEGVGPVSENVYLCLYRAVQELLFNVVKHARVGEAEVAILKAGEQSVQVTVKDRGAGFSAGVLSGLGMMGLGFGLCSIRERVEGLGGHMEIVSEEAGGTAVTLTLPSREAS